jgi:hypothetical protein
MSSGYRNSDEYGGPRQRSFVIWMWMAGVIAVMFLAVWMLTGEVHPNLL